MGNVKQILMAAIVTLLAGSATAAGVRAPLQMRPDSIIIKQGSRAVRVSLRCPKFVFESRTLGTDMMPLSINGGIAGGRPVEVTYSLIPVGATARMEVKLFVQWSSRERVVRKWARYRLDGPAELGAIKEIVLDELAGQTLSSRFEPDPPQSRPVFGKGFFFGVEFPIASTRVEGGRIILAHRPGQVMQPGVWYESRKAVYGIANAEYEKRDFVRYISANRPSPRGVHANYNSWWTSPVPYSESDILGLIETFRNELVEPFGASFDTFCIDMGWSNRKSVWEIEGKLFPDGFVRLQQAAEKAKCHLGVWVSPSSCYPDALDNDWAQQQGYETFVDKGWGGADTRFACLAGEKYASGFRDRLVEMAAKYGVRHFKFDGYRPVCHSSEHGHQPGELSAEPVAEGIISTFAAIRKAAPDTWMETTCFGWNPSPWWLFHANSVLGTYGDDAPYGRVPCPVYRESYTTARDYFNLQGAAQLPLPIGAQEVLGVVHQTPEPFMNDAVMTVMRGHMFMPAYINPKFMSEGRWKAFADLLKWAKANATRLQETQPLLPVTWQNGKCPRFTDSARMPREPYGYAHWYGASGLVALRNPWIKAQAYSLKIGAKGKHLNVVSIYPEPRVYARNVSTGGILRVPLAPYETVVLSVSSSAAPKAVPDVAKVISGRVRVDAVRREVSNVEFDGSEEAFGPDWTSLVGDTKSATVLRAEGKVTLDASQGELLILLEDSAPTAFPLCRVTVNGKEAEVSSTGSETGWSASGLKRPEEWLFLRAPLAEGENSVVVDAQVAKSAKVSIWAWATKPGAAMTAGGLPAPEVVSLGSVALMEPVLMSSVTKTTRRERPVERIDGVFLDSLEPTSVFQGWGSLQRNHSVWEKPLSIGAQRYLRGLGTHAPSRIVYALGAKYRRFQCKAGADSATGPTVTFEVMVDGVKKWESRLMTRTDPAQIVDIDVTGAKTLELIVGDGGNGMMADHADWVDARLLK